jgi:hypothetical protein
MTEPRPLHLPQEPVPATQVSGNPRKPGRWRANWLVPLAAALAVIAVAATLVAIRNLPGSPPTGPRPDAKPTGQPAARTPPRYYVTLGPQGKNFTLPLVAGDVSTGKRIATIIPPANATFSGVTGAADDRTFVVDLTRFSQRGGRRVSSHSWELLRLVPGAVPPVRLSPLPIKAPLTQAEIQGLALSPDAGTLALMFQPNVLSYVAGRPPVPGPITLQTYSLDTGRLLRSWTRPWNGAIVNVTPNTDNSAGLSWTSNSRTLAFTDPEAGGQPSLRALRVDSPGRDLLAASRIVFVLPSGHWPCYLPVLASDGREVLCGAGPSGVSCGKYQAEFDAYSTLSGGKGPVRLERVIYRHRGGCTQMFATAASAGAAVIGVFTAFSVVGHTSKVTLTAGVLTPSSFTPFRTALPDLDTLGFAF